MAVSSAALDMAEPRAGELASYGNWPDPNAAGPAVYGMRADASRLALIHVKQMGRHVV